MDLEIETREYGAWWVVSVQGELDIASAPRLREAVIDVVTSGHAEVIVDLDGVDFIDSTGLGVLVGALKRTRTHGGDLRIVCASRRVLDVFDLTGLDQVFVLSGSLEEAAG